MAINTGKVVAGGLLAGLVFNIGDFVINNLILGAEFQQTATRLGLDPTLMESPAGIIPGVIIDFLYGLLAVWTYAAMRPRFGPGPQTAVVAGLVLFIAGTLWMAGLTSMGMFTYPLFLKMTAFGVVNVAIGSVAGAWLYSE